MLTQENYHSNEMNKKYMSVSQFKRFFFDCQAQAMAELNKEVERVPSIDMKIGSYVDAHFSGTMELFKAKNPDMISGQGKTKGNLKSGFVKADEVIKRIERDNLFMEYMDGEMQEVKTGFIEGVEFKAMFDVIHKDKIVDLKVMKDLKKMYKNGLYLDFIEFYGYDFQGAIYQAIHGKNLPFFIAVATKEVEPNIAILEIPQERLDYCLDLVQNSIEHIVMIKNGLIEPNRCECCNYCKSTKELTKAVPYDEFFNNN